MHQNPTCWYDRVAFLYGSFLYHSFTIGVYNRARKVTAEQLKLLPGRRVLDLACGTGENFRYTLPVIGSTCVLITPGLTVIPDWQTAFERTWELLRPDGRLTLMNWHVS